MDNFVAAQGVERNDDPYIWGKQCIDRLLTEYRLHKKLIIAFDFDDTVFDFHQAGRSYERIIHLLKRCQELGFFLVMFTGSAAENWLKQVLFMERLGIKVSSVNKNPIKLPFGNDGKIYFNILLDDRAGLGQAYATLLNVVNTIESETL